MPLSKNQDPAEGATRIALHANVIPVVVLTWNSGRKKLQDWLRSVEGLTPPSDHRVRPVIVDNGSSDITPAVIAEAIVQGKVAREDVHWLPSNYGFVKAHNVVFRHLIAEKKCRFVATLNEDATADPGWLAALVDAASHESPESRVGMWGGPIHCPSPNQNLISSAGHRLRKRDGAFLDIDRNLPPTSDLARSSKGDFKLFCPCFAAALWSLEMMASIGLPDSDQFMYYDDVDLGYRARLNDWEARYVPTAKAFHPLPQSTPRSGFLLKHQQMGRLAIVCRYLPDQERARILTEMSENLRVIYEEMKWEGRKLEPIGTPERRSRLWNEWAK